MNTNAQFYDIESLENVFTVANFKEKENHVDVFFLIDDPDLIADPNWCADCTNVIYDNNDNFSGTVSFYDLNNPNNANYLAQTFGCWDSYLINDKSLKPKDVSYPPYFRLVCDTDEEYDPELHPYLMGYNSYNYDTTMLALYFSEIFYDNQEYEPSIDDHIHTLAYDSKVTAKFMRAHNDKLFTKQFKNSMPSYLAAMHGGGMNWQSLAVKIRKNMLLSGRHLDVARLNEKQSKVALKRLLGMFGFQIRESDKLSQNQTRINSKEELYDLIAYNVSDIVNLRELFYLPFYQSQFELKKGMLTTYPELIYEKKDNEYAPDIRPNRVRRNRLYIDSSSAQLATMTLCPYGHLTDIPVVSFLYPAKEMADKLGIQQVNVLEEAKKFFCDTLYPGPEHEQIRNEFMNVYHYYKSIEGKNFNDSETYKEDYPEAQYPELYPVNVLSQIPKPTENNGTFLRYFDRNGEPTTCYAIFSTGGVHGAEYNKTLYDEDMATWLAACKDMEEVQTKYPNPVDLRKAKKVTMSDGRTLEYKVFLKAGRKIADSEYRDLEDARPKLITFNEKNMTKLTDRYTYTSADEANHEDFKSYYPNLLRMMMAFFNKGLNYDRYAEIFDQKEEYGVKMKDASYPKEEQNHFKILREGTKLILNSASGAADATFQNNIRVNNQIISMRIIGQLFSWRIGQAQTYAGAKMTSTNTDGLYSVMEQVANNATLERESKDIGVEIEPEPMYLISKDTNNRIELSGINGKILSASGGTLGCRKGPSPTKALPHPAVIDWALAEYLIVAASGYKGLSLEKPFDDDIGRSIIQTARKEFKEDHLHFLLMFQNILASSPSTINYHYAWTDTEPTKPIILQHYNRMFIMKEGTPNTIHLRTANAKKITPAQKRKRAKEPNTRPQLFEQPALRVLQAHGVTQEDIGTDRDVISKKITNVEPEWYIYILNRNLHTLSDADFQYIYDNLDYEKYLDKLREAYTNSWKNANANIYPSAITA